MKLGIERNGPDFISLQKSAKVHKSPQLQGVLGFERHKTQCRTITFRFGTVVVQSICYLRKALCNGLFIARSNRSATRTKGVPSLPTHKVIEEAYRLGASFVLPKSFTARALVERIHDALRSDRP